ncbi:MAG: cysteine desulfurase [Nanoarchaeota archaeon]|nr:cysteine desulfurase [Nanoarchaeota archaeon]MBU1501238.1 cysteine desulfurase [Nanoarchaeota archaeon]
MKLTNSSVKKLKEDFPIFKNNPGLIYLDSAATSQRPSVVIQAFVDFYEKENANISRGVYTLAEKATRRYDEAREVIAKFIGANPKEIIFTRNATEGLNLLSYTLNSIIPEGKNEILITEMEHHSNLVPWQQLVQRGGFNLKFVQVKDDFTLDIEDLKEKLTDKTAIVSVTHISNVLGTINPVEEISRIAKERGALVIVDAAQSAPSIKIDVKKIDCDFIVFSGHKMLGPGGIGVLCGRAELLEKMHPFNFGGGMIKKVTLENTEFASPPERFEAGTQNIAGAIALAEAIKYLDKIGLENIQEWEKELTFYAIKKLKEIGGMKIYNSESDKKIGIISFNLKDIHPHDVASLLNDSKIAIRAGHHCAMPLMKRLEVVGTCRASFYVYNTLEDVDALISALKKVKEKFE